MARKLTAIETMYRTEKILEMLVKGFQMKDIRKMLQDCYDLTTRQYQDKVIRDARKTLKQDKAGKEDRRAINDARLDFLYERAVKDKNYTLAVKVIDTSNKTNGVYEHEKGFTDSDTEYEVDLGE